MLPADDCEGVCVQEASKVRDAARCPYGVGALAPQRPGLSVCHQLLQPLDLTLELRNT